MRLGGTSEVAGQLGISRQRLAQIRDRAGFPAPIAELSAGPIWDLDAVALWSSSGLRRSAGRPTEPQVVLGRRYLLDPVPIGSGGFADVYRATNITESESKQLPVVAIKVLRNLDDEEVKRRFERELRLVRQCRHPNIVAIIDYGEDSDGTLWYAMPLAKGSLADEGDRFVGNDEEILHLMRQLCDGMAYVHKMGIFHRDLKPANILRMGTDTWAISDFGLAREAERTTTALTSTMQGVGTYFYSAPEAWRGAKHAEVPADIFGLGKVLHHVVTGEVPVDSDEISGRFRPIVRKATRQRPQERYQTVNELQEAIRRVATTEEGWVSIADVAESLGQRLTQDAVDDSVLDDLMEVLSADDPHSFVEIRKSIPLMKEPLLERLWERSPDDFRLLVAQFSERAAYASWEFSFCDTIADFLDRAFKLSNDDDVLRDSLYALFEIGKNHNRFYVREVTVELLQRIRSANSAMAAAAAVELAGASAVGWTVSTFVRRSLHPTIREAIESSLGRQAC